MLSDLLANAAAAGVDRMITVGTAPDDWSLYRQLAADYPHRIFYTIGLHPCSVDDDWRDAVAELERQLEAGGMPRPVAVGEIGLDAFHLPNDPVRRQQLIDMQRQAFSAQLELAARHDLPVVIHSRGALAESLAMLQASPVDPSRAVFHCFTEGAEEMRALIASGARGSFTGIATYPKADAVRASLRVQGTGVLMLETDSPYLAPQQRRGKPNEPAFLRLIAETVAAELSMDLTELAAVTTRNCREFFSIH